MKRKNIILIGAGGHATSCIDVIEATNKYKIIGLIDKKKKTYLKIGNKKYKIFNEKEIFDNKKKFYALICIGSNLLIKKRNILFKKYKKLGFKFPTIISPFSYVSKFSKIKDGTIIMHKAIINSNVKIGSNCIINTKSLIEHDCVIGDNSHIATSANINGHVKIGKNCFIGSNSTLVPSVKIKDNSFIKAGRLIKKNYA